MPFIANHAPKNNSEFRQAVYDGQVFLLPRTEASGRLAEMVLELVEEEMGAPVREAQFRLSGDEFFQAVGRLRKVLYQEPRFYHASLAAAAEYGFEGGRNAYDPLRLRVMTHGGHENPAAAPIYYTHRDTWYSHPQCQISWWIPLHDLEEEETFVFYPGYFNRPVENDSGGFDYDTWIRDRRSLRIGWQDKNAGTQAFYPGCHTDMAGAETVRFSIKSGEILVFAGAHLHQTRSNTTGRTRFSVDFRTADLDDHARGIGAPNADNRSTGSALQDYFQPGHSLPSASAPA